MPIILNGSSGITYPDNTTQTTTAQAAKAWVNFNGQGTVAIRESASFNVSSITDIGVGRYQVNFTTAFSDANYITFGDCSIEVGRVFFHIIPGAYEPPTTSSFKILINNIPNTAQIDPTIVSILVHR